MSTLPVVRDTHVNAALRALNEAKRLKYPDVGYTYYADVRGDGRSRKALWVIINENGGVSRSSLNAPTKRAMLECIKRATLNVGRNRMVMTVTTTTNVSEGAEYVSRPTYVYQCTKTERNIKFVPYRVENGGPLVIVNEMTQDELHEALMEFSAYFDSHNAACPHEIYYTPTV